MKIKNEILQIITSKKKCKISQVTCGNVSLTASCIAMSAECI